VASRRVGDDAPDTEGEKLFVGFAGVTVPVIDPFNGDTQQAHIFVVALGSLQLTPVNEFGRTISVL
jgi:hypothetical protein